MNFKKNLPKSVRILISVLLFLVFTGVFFIPPGVSSTSAAAQSVIYKVQFVPALMRFLSLWTIGSVTTVLVIWGGTLLFGRAYCSSICPLGTVQDICFHMSKRRKKNVYRAHNRLRWILQYSVIFSAIVFLSFGFSLFLGIIEPLSIFSRFLTDFARPTLINGLIKLSPVFQKNGIYLDVELVRFTSIGALSGFCLLTAVGISAFIKGRWYCNTICPTGSLLAPPASFSLFRININQDICTSCGLCEKNCKSGCISSLEKRVANGDCVLCFSCLSVCSYHAISYRRKPTVRSVSQEYGLTGTKRRWPKNSRRKFITNTGLSALGLGVFLLTPAAKLFGENLASGNLSIPPTDNTGLLVLPPGADSYPRFISRCTSCHICIAGCPQQVIRSAGMKFGISILGKPVLDYSLSFCEFECSSCSRLCPTGALIPLSLEEKKVTKLGTAAIEDDLCIVYTDETSCGACAEICPTTAVFMIPYLNTLTAPEVTSEICIGCGACQRVCPVEGVKAIRVTGQVNHTKADIRNELPFQAVSSPEGSRPEERKRLLKEGFELKAQEDPFAF
jgi:ferredoxin